jgi:hypothetical protein
MRIGTLHTAHPAHSRTSICSLVEFSLLLQGKEQRRCPGQDGTVKVISEIHEVVPIASPRTHTELGEYSNHNWL